MSHMWAVRAALQGILEELEASSNPTCKGAAENIRQNRETVVGDLMTYGETDIGGFRLSVEGSFLPLPAWFSCSENGRTSERAEDQAHSFEAAD